MNEVLIIIKSESGKKKWYVCVNVCKEFHSARGNWGSGWFKNPQGVVSLPNELNLFHILAVIFNFV